MNWDAAERHSNECAAPEMMPSGVALPPAPSAASARVQRVVVVDHFDPTMIDMGRQGARLIVRPLSRPEAMQIVRESRPEVVTLNERSASFLEKELQMVDPAPRPRVSYGVAMIVVVRLAWNDIRWFWIEYECDGDGCIG